MIRIFRSGAVLMLIAVLAPLSGCSLPKPFRVMTFNIRYDNPDDGENAWPNRRELVLDVIRTKRPDLLGVQEALKAQTVDLCEGLPDYEFVGVGRDDGREKGEFSPILYRRDRFMHVRSGTIWLSETPEHAGSVGWDAALPRIATWVTLRCRENPLIDVTVINTHFDHRGERARLESARLLRNTAESLGGVPLIVMGDFNAPPGSPPHGALTGDRRPEFALIDGYANLHPDAPNPGTFNGFRRAEDSGRIDWILHSRRFRATSAEVDRRSEGGRFPSDHFPVIHTLELVPVTDSGVM